MFKDYYQILRVPFGSSFEQIRSSYRSLSLQYHPDRNKTFDTTAIMCDINEAYSLLRDSAKRARYDREYQRYKAATQVAIYRNSQSRPTPPPPPNQQRWVNYTIQDPHVAADMTASYHYAQRLVAEFMARLRANAKVAARGAWEEVWPWILGISILLILGIIVAAVSS